MLDPLQAPTQFFQEMTRLIRSAALFLSLSPPTREYFRLLGEIGEVEFVSMLSRRAKRSRWAAASSIDDDLSVEAQKVVRAARAARSARAGARRASTWTTASARRSKASTSCSTARQAIRCCTSRWPKPARPQAHGQELTFVFAPLRLEARERYRLVLVGDRQARFAPGDRLTRSCASTRARATGTSPTIDGRVTRSTGSATSRSTSTRPTTRGNQRSARTCAARSRFAAPFCTCAAASSTRARPWPRRRRCARGRLRCRCATVSSRARGPAGRGCGCLPTSRVRAATTIPNRRPARDETACCRSPGDVP